MESHIHADLPRGSRGRPPRSATAASVLRRLRRCWCRRLLALVGHAQSRGTDTASSPSFFGTPSGSRDLLSPSGYNNKGGAAPSSGGSTTGPARASSGLSGPAGASPHRLPIPSTALPSAFSALLLSLASFFGRAASLGSPVPSPLERPHDLPRVAWPRVAVAVQPHRPSSRGVADSPERLYLSPEPRPSVPRLAGEPLARPRSPAWVGVR